MSSSISTSEPGATERDAPDGEAYRAWRRWIAAFCAAFFGVGGALYILLLLIDPYDSSRFPNFGLIGIHDVNPRTAHASRGRNPRFDSAIFGNSTAQLIDPYRLSEATGMHFTQLTTPQLGPREELALMGWVLRNHRHIGAWVVVTDPGWCSPDPNLDPRYPFPFWLYGNDFGYLASVLNSRSLDRAVKRLQVALGQEPPTDQVGYFDYTAASKDWAYLDPPPRLSMASPSQARESFPWIDALRQFVGRMPTDAAVVLVMPPVYYTMIPESGSPVAERLDHCKAALARSVAGRARSGFLDFRTDTPDTRDPANFGDGVHYRKKLARQEEDGIIGLLRTARVAEH